MKGESGAHRVTMRVDRRDPFKPLQLKKVEAVLKSPFDGTCVRSTPRLFGSTAKRSPPRVFAANRHSSLFEDRFRLKPLLSDLFRHLGVTSRPALTLVCDEQYISRGFGVRVYRI
jgi:hypothetical protein